MGVTEFHIPVLSSKAIEGLDVKEGGKYIDATVGGGGHTLEILKRGGDVLGIDCDPEAIEHIKKKWKSTQRRISSESENGKWRGRLTLVRGNFAHLKEIAQSQGFGQAAGILFDLGVSTHQLEKVERGFSFNTDAPLDMRMDPDLTVTAADLVHGLNEGELYELFKKYSEEYHSWAIARAIVRARTLKPITTCNKLAEIVVRTLGRRGKFDRIHPATRIFQALRIAVNDELNNLKEGLPVAVSLLERKGRLVVLSFHSLEDRIVKNFFKEKGKEGILEILTKKPVIPEKEEIWLNPRSRSAKLRIAQKA